MTPGAILAAMTPADLLALAWLTVAWLGIGRLADTPPAGYPSVSILMVSVRRDWMQQFVTRQPRIFDASIIDSLRQGTSFLASACMIAIGGGVALVGSQEKLRAFAPELAAVQIPAAIWQAKVLLIIILLANALFKFVWSHRLFGYCAILMASVPNDPADPKAYARAATAAEINIAAARSHNRGLRSVYFALGALGWLLGPYALMLTTLLALAVTWRREFASHSRSVLLADLDQQ